MKRDNLIGLSLVCALLFSHALYAEEIAGVSIPDTVTVGDSTKELLLNGAGIRKKLFFDIYVGALYLTKRTTDAQEAIDTPGEKRILMHFTYNEVSRQKLVNAWYEGFEANNSAEVLKAIKPRIDRFAGLFRDAHKSDIYWLNYIPGKGTRVVLNETVLGNIEGEDFNRALLRIWLGEKPITEKLKKAMLGRR